MGQTTEIIVLWNVGVDNYSYTITQVTQSYKLARNSGISRRKGTTREITNHIDSKTVS